jgi:hypothetical protein
MRFNMNRRGKSDLVAPKKKELDARLQDLAESHKALVESVHRLATHTSVLAVAVRDPQAVPADDLAATLAGIAEISRTTRFAGSIFAAPARGASTVL